MRPLMGLEMLGRHPHLQRISPFSMEDGLRFSGQDLGSIPLWLRRY